MIALFLIIGNGLLALITEIFKLQKILFALTLVLLVGAFSWNLWEWNHTLRIMAFENMIAFNQLELVLSNILIGGTLIWFFLHRNHSKKIGTDTISLVLFALSGGILLCSFQNLTTLFIGVELLSIPLYILAASDKESADSHEAGFKYLIMGAFASALLLFGIALLYGGSGSFDMSKIQLYFNSQNELPSFVKLGVLLILISFCFKTAIAPFHFWSPDVYEGAPLTITAFMSTVGKIASFFAFFKLALFSFTSTQEYWIPVLTVLAVISLIVSNTTALQQTRLKRLFAYSGISHSAFLLLIIVAHQQTAFSINALVLYASSYIISGLGAFSIISKHGDNMSEYESFGKNFPLSAISFSICILSMAGIPVTAGFFAKFMVFQLLFLSPVSIAIIILAITAALVGIFYYLRFITSFYTTPEDVWMNKLSSNQNWIAIICALGLVVLGLFPQILGGVFTF